jgi:peroxiredoxin family protein
MPTDPAERPGTADLAVIVFAGDFERIHYALVLATAAAAIGGQATLFFTGDAVRALVAGNAWQRLPAAGGALANEVDAGYRRRGVVGFAELLDAAAALGIRIIVCEMGLRVLGLARSDLCPDLTIEEAGIVTLLADPAAQRLVFI